ncbi:hypothetical protein TcasGA2_TC014570 [Tribolium castaneum]|uniref:Uncharacterized protein n=1 Tax=Tribolium castaneum TaxID=7070 RepID=D6WMJ3_TRICA|nr:hypothetical protein TcasGA2_TC014570 [Tribolium castaneum]
MGGNPVNMQRLMREIKGLEKGFEYCKQYDVRLSNLAKSNISSQYQKVPLIALITKP